MQGILRTVLVCLLVPASATAQGADLCSNAQGITGLGQFAFDNNGALTDGPPGCRAMSDVWFAWTAPATGQYVVSTCDLTNVDTYIAVYDGFACPPTVEIGCNDDACATQSSITFDAFAAGNYLLRIGGFNTWQGSGSFEIRQVPNGGANDCVDAVAIAGTGFFPWNNGGFTDDGPPACAPMHKDLWFRWVAPTTDVYSFTLCGKTVLDSVLVLYDGTSCPPGAAVGCSDDDCGEQSEIVTTLLAGNEYLIRLGSSASDTAGHGHLGIQTDPCSTIANDDALEDNDDCPNAVGVNSGLTTGLWCSKADPDWYVVTLPPFGTVELDLHFAHSSGDLDLALYADDCQDLLATSTGVGDDEEIVWNNDSGLFVDIRINVYVFSGSTQACNVYDIDVTGPGGGIGSKYCTSTPNSTGSPADLTASGSNSASAGDLMLVASPVPNSTAIFFHAADQAELPFGNGFLCAVNDIVRSRPLHVSGNVASYLYDNSDTKHSLFDFVSKRRNFQFWFRDPPAGGAFFNTSNAITLIVLP